jgi:hypothetical protein
MLPSGQFVPSSITGNFMASFNGGTDTFGGTDSVMGGPPNSMGMPTILNTFTILSGTGIFNGATGFATGTSTTGPSPGQVSTLGSGQITAPAIPEPRTITLLSTAIVGLAGLAAMQKKRRRSN